MKQTKQNYLQMRGYYLRKKREAEENIKQLDEVYIEKNAPYKIGTKLRVDCNGSERVATIDSYHIDKNGVLIPSFKAPNKVILTYFPYTILEEVK